MITLPIFGLVLAVFATAGQPALALTPQRKASSVVVTPTQVSLTPQTMQWFSAVVLDNRGRPVSGRVSVKWQILPAAGQIVQTTDTAALVRAGPQPGAYLNAVTATVDESVAGAASINIAAAQSIRVVIAPAVDSATVGDARLFTASAVDQQNTPAPLSSVAWQVAPALGVIQSSGALTALVQMGGQPGFFQNVITATAAGAAPGTASVVLSAGPPARIVVSPASATVAVNSTQAFTAAVFDRFGNPLNLGVTWLAQEGAATIESFTANSVVVRAGTRAGVFAGGLRAVQSDASNAVTLTVPAGPPAALLLNPAPQTIKTDGQNSSVIAAQVVDAFGNPAGEGAQVSLSVEACAGACTLTPQAGAADAQGRFAATLRSTFTSPTQALTSQIRVNGAMQAGAVSASASTVVTGTFTPATVFIGVMARAYPINNHTSCTALRISPPAIVNQPPNQAFNLYRFTAAQPALNVRLSNFASIGQLLLYRINADACAVNGTVSVTFIQSTPIAGGTTLVRLDNLLAGRPDYLLAVQTTGALSNVPYRLDIAP